MWLLICHFSIYICGQDRENGTWEGWIEFHPTDASHPTLSTERETSQPHRKALEYWADGLEPIYRARTQHTSNDGFVWIEDRDSSAEALWRVVEWDVYEPYEKEHKINERATLPHSSAVVFWEWWMASISVGLRMKAEALQNVPR